MIVNRVKQSEKLWKQSRADWMSVSDRDRMSDS